MKPIIFVLVLLVSGTTFGKTTYIQADKLPVSPQKDAHLRYIMEQEKYVPTSFRQGGSSVTNSSLKEGFLKAYDFFRQQDATNPEVNLLLGDICCCLYHLDGGSYMEAAEKYYKTAQQLAPLDFRAFWFMGCMYGSVNDAIRAVDCYRKAQSRLPKSEPAEFWDQYAQVANTANMPSTSLFAMEKARAASGRMGEFERTNGLNVRNRLLESNSNRTYTNKELWTYDESDKIVFTSRPLGLQICIEPEWELDISDFDRKQASFTIKCTDENDPGNTFLATVTTRVAAESDDLNQFLTSQSAEGPEKTEIKYSDKYPGMISYELFDALLDKEKGGRHSYLLGIRRKQPLYPGLSLEKPQEQVSGDPIRTRFAGTIFYAIRLDASESVFPLAKRMFQDLFENHLLVE
jgi:tetratricopeptide (TPR) repeat protein